MLQEGDVGPHAAPLETKKCRVVCPKTPKGNGVSTFGVDRNWARVPPVSLARSRPLLNEAHRIADPHCAMLKLFGWGKEASDEEEEEDESPLAVSSPRDFRRGIHVSHDTASNTFTGVPSAWRNAVPNSASESAAVSPHPPPLHHER